MSDIESSDEPSSGYSDEDVIEMTDGRIFQREEDIPAEEEPKGEDVWEEDNDEDNEEEEEEDDSFVVPDGSVSSEEASHSSASFEDSSAEAPPKKRTRSERKGK
jgi:hypothetical protein